MIDHEGWSIIYQDVLSTLEDLNQSRKLNDS